MPTLLTAHDLHKHFGPRTLFSGISIGLEDRERVGLIGPNGSGKSTLLRIVAGLEHADEGGPIIRKGIRVAYVAQSDVFPESATVLTAVTSALAGAPPPHLHDEHEIELAATLALDRVGFADLDQPVSALSGGRRKRLAIARALAAEPDVLLLDEPTNHLDVHGILWLEGVLRSSRLASIFITHDRAFLERVATRIAEISRAYPDGAFTVAGDYSNFLRRKGEFLDSQARQEHALAGIVREDLRWLARGAKARRTKSKSRIDAAHERIDELAELRVRNSQDRAAAIDFTATDRMTQRLLFARAISKSLGGRPLFSDLDVLLAPGQCLGLMGPNGAGKTTLIRVLTGELEPDPPTPESLARAAANADQYPRSAPPPGAISRADKLRTVVFSQHRTELDQSHTLAQALSPQADSVIYRGRLVHVAAWANRFLFTKEQLNHPVAALSGGEQARIHIARLMLEPADVLILDEPTNDLDIASLEVLEESLEDFPGAVVLVTHDRAMLARLATRILALDGCGNARYFTDYDQWEAFAEQRARSPAANRAADSPTTAATPVGTFSSPAISKKKLSYKEQRELDQIEPNIEKADIELKRLEARMNDPAVVADRRVYSEVCGQFAQAQTRLAGLYERWTELEARRNS